MSTYPRQPSPAGGGPPPMDQVEREALLEAKATAEAEAATAKAEAAEAQAEATRATAAMLDERSKRLDEKAARVQAQADLLHGGGELDPACA